jgi:MGT family glycosyltransferase
VATILAYTSPALGHVYPITALLLELRSRGHRVVVRTPAAAVSLSRAAGFEAAAVDPRIEGVALRDWTARNPLGALKLTMEVFGARGMLEVDDARRAIDEVAPDALIVDANCWGAASVADAASLPWAAFWPYPPFLRSRGVPPFGPGLAPWPGLAGRLRDCALRPLTTGALERAMLSALAQVRSAAGATVVRSADEFVARAPLLLLASAEPFEYPHPDWPATAHFIGPCAYDPAPATVPAWLAEIDQPIVLVTNSTEYQNDSALPLTAMQALADHRVHVVATFPSGVPRDMIPPPNATVRQTAPHGLILDRAVCAITHGGMGSTQKALARGVPVCVVPYGRDQLEVARRVEVAQCGTRLPARKLTVQRLRRAVDEALLMTDGARRVAEGYAATGGVTKGAVLIERHILGSRPA